MTQKLKIRAMLLAINKKLPSDGYASVQEWVQRQTERFKDGGFTQSEIDSMVTENLHKAQAREEAKLRLDGLIDARMRGVDQSGREVVLEILKNTGIFFNLRPGRDLQRMSAMVKSSKSCRVRTAYAQVHSFLSSYVTCPAVQAFFDANAKGTAAWGELFHNIAWWRPTPDAQANWYSADLFVPCPLSHKKFPSVMALDVVCNERGGTMQVHPNMARDQQLRRDVTSGAWVLVSAVEWVQLDTGESVWKAGNEAAGRIYYDDDLEVWVRSSTRGGVARYHGGRRDWIHARSETTRNCIGVELECGFKSSGHLSKFLNRFVDASGRFINERPFLIENDSSLGGVIGGCEIISEPLPLWEGYQAPDSQWRWLLDKLNHNGGQGWKHRNVAGIHVNMDVQGRPVTDIVRFIALINNAASISRFVSGRKGIFGARHMDSAENSQLADIDAFALLDKNQAGGGYGRVPAASADVFRSMQERGKYNPVHIRPNGKVLEVRIFGANIRYEGFMACVEYCVSGLEYVSTTDADVTHPELGKHFRQWLSENAAKYPNLVARLGSKAADSSVVAAARPLLEMVA